MSAMPVQNNSQTGLSKFQLALNSAELREIRVLFRSKKNKRLLAEEIYKDLFDLGPPTPPFKRTGRIVYRQKLNDQLLEILTALETMRDIEYYIGKFPYHTETISKHRHLQFHVEAFLHEAYILQIRLCGLFTFIERQHKKDARLPQIKAACSATKKAVIESMNRIVKLRSEHVHQTRLRIRRIEKLKTLTLYTIMPDRKVKNAFASFYESEYKQARKIWRAWIAQGNTEAKILTDACFEQAYKIVFDGSGELTYPGNLNF